MTLTLTLIIMIDIDKNLVAELLVKAAGNFGCVVPAGAWHTVEVLEPSVIFEAKDGRFGEDGSESA